MNTITVTGRLTHDPDRRTVTVGDDERSVTTLPLALDDHRRTDAPCFIDAVCWGGVAEACASHLRKGRHVAVTGRLDLSRWTDEAGVRHQRHRIVATEVDFLDRPEPATSAA